MVQKRLVIKVIINVAKKSGGSWVGGWMGGWMGVKAILRIAYSNKK